MRRASCTQLDKPGSTAQLTTVTLESGYELLPIPTHYGFTECRMSTSNPRIVSVCSGSDRVNVALGQLDGGERVTGGSASRWKVTVRACQGYAVSSRQSGSLRDQYVKLTHRK